MWPKRLHVAVLLSILLTCPLLVCWAESDTGYYPRSGPTGALTAGTVLDVAPYGLEKHYYSLQGTYRLEGNPAVSAKPSVSLNGTAAMFRLPLLLDIGFFRREDRRGFYLYWYAGGGAEFYSSTDESTLSPLLTSGIAFCISIFYLDITTASAYRPGNTDSDVGITAGVFFHQ
jgi:hypothetical protein